MKRSKLKCVSCGRPADFEVPEPWCKKHWAEWWCEPDESGVSAFTLKETYEFFGWDEEHEES